MPDRETQAQIARVIFEAIANGKSVTDVQRSQLTDWIRGKDIQVWDATPSEGARLRVDSVEDFIAGRYRIE